MPDDKNKILSPKINDIISQADEFLKDLAPIGEPSSAPSEPASTREAKDIVSDTPEEDKSSLSELRDERKAEIAADNHGSQKAWILLGFFVFLAFLIPVAVNLIKESEIEPSGQQAKKEQPPQVMLQPERNDRPDRYGLKTTEPSSAQLQGLLQTWLNRKAAVLSGGSLANARLADVARSGLLDQVRSERSRDAAAGTTQNVQASITSIDVVSSSPARIELKAQVAYRDERLNAAGKVIERTAATTYPITYVLGRYADQWRLEAYWRTKD